ncbi:MAG: hypothetical protein HXY34_00950 [Candidatus Thorarchaeota archaeon]|nr:hypothetical protein [Candidatus Thorarchaeota archaeon]
MQNLSNTEESASELLTFPPFLYSALRERIKRFRNDKTSLDPETYYDEIQRTQRIFSSLVESRIAKLIRVVTSSKVQEMRKRMTSEELWLCEELATLLTEWQTNVGGSNSHSE